LTRPQGRKEIDRAWRDQRGGDRLVEQRDDGTGVDPELDEPRAAAGGDKPLDRLACTEEPCGDPESASGEAALETTEPPACIQSQLAAFRDQAA
jgi:hypothetical protein